MRYKLANLVIDLYRNRYYIYAFLFSTLLITDIWIMQEIFGKLQHGCQYIMVTIIFLLFMLIQFILVFVVVEMIVVVLLDILIKDDVKMEYGLYPSSILVKVENDSMFTELLHLGKDLKNDFIKLLAYTESPIVRDRILNVLKHREEVYDEHK